MKYLIITILIVLSSCTPKEKPETAYQLNFEKKIPPAIVHNDIAALQSILEEAQTSIYRFSSKGEVNLAFKNVLENSDSLSYLEFIRQIAKIQNIIACGHSGWSHSKEFMDYRNKNMSFFPIDISVVEGRYFVKKDYSLHPSIYEGNEILTINNSPVSKITQQLKTHMVQDGNSGLNGTYGVEHFFRKAYSNFIDNPTSFDLLLKSPNGDTSLVNVKTMLLSKIDSVKQLTINRDNQKTKLPLIFTTIDSLNTAVYSIQSFRNERIEINGQEYISFTDSIFQVVTDQRINNLIIDLRNNSGGWTANGKHLFSYFIKKTTPYIQTVEVKKYQNFSFDTLITNYPGYTDTFDLKLNTDNNYEWKNYPSLIANPAPNNNFNGQVYVLINNMSRSCSSAFSALMQDHTEAILVGEETGASKCGSSAMVMSIKLPHTGVDIHFSTAKYYFNVLDKNNTKGIIPDIAIKNTIKDFDYKGDKVFEFILNEIKNDL